MVPILLLGTQRFWWLEFRKKLSFLAGTGIEPLPFGSKECYALLTGAITTRLYRSQNIEITKNGIKKIFSSQFIQLVQNAPFYVARYYNLNQITYNYILHVQESDLI